MIFGGGLSRLAGVPVEGMCEASRLLSFEGGGEMQLIGGEQRYLLDS